MSLHPLLVDEILFDDTVAVMLFQIYPHIISKNDRMRTYYRILFVFLRWDRSVIHDLSVKPFLPRYVLKEALHNINGSVSVGLACDRHERERVRDPAGHRKRFGECLRQHSRDGRAVEASHRKYCQLGILDRFNGTDICDYIGLEIDMRNRRFVGRTMVKIRFAFMLRTVFV